MTTPKTLPLPPLKADAADSGRGDGFLRELRADGRLRAVQARGVDDASKSGNEAGEHVGHQKRAVAR